MKKIGCLQSTFAYSKKNPGTLDFYFPGIDTGNATVRHSSSRAAAGFAQGVVPTRAVSQLLGPDKDREVCFSLGENHEQAYRFPYFLPRSAEQHAA
jgi:hypothetical protein